MQSTIAIVLFITLIGSVAAHSWINNPAGRFPNIPNYNITYDDGTVYTDKNGNKISGTDAQGTDMYMLRPTTFLTNPCFYEAGATFDNVPTSVVEEDGVLCVQWAANSHDTDSTRNIAGGVRFSITDVTGQPTQADFDKNILATIPYESFAGAKIQIPPQFKPGQYVLEFYWYWPIPASGNNPDITQRLFTSCSNLTILAHGDPALQTQQSSLGMGLPAGYTVPPNYVWECKAGDAVYTNASNPVNNPWVATYGNPTNPPNAVATPAPGKSGSAMSATPAPTPAPATASPAPTQGGSSQVTTIAPTTPSKATVAPAATNHPAPTNVPGPNAAGTRSVTDGASLAQALADGVATITLANGQYNVPSQYGFKIVSAGTKLLALNAGSVTIVGSSGFYGLNVQGAGAYIYGVTVTGCASAAYVTSSSATFDTVKVNGNSNNVGIGAGVHAIVGSVVTIVNSVITMNTGYAGVYCLGSCTVQNSKVTMNGGGGVTARYSATVNVVNSLIDSNIGSGIFASDNSNVFVQASNITSNAGALYGGGIGAINSNVNIAGSLIMYNSAKNAAGGVYINSNAGVSVVANNSQIVGNTAPGANSGFMFTMANNVKVSVINTKLDNSASSSASSADEYFCCNGVYTKTPSQAYCSYPAANPCPAAW